MRMHMQEPLLSSPALTHPALSARLLTQPLPPPTPHRCVCESDVGSELVTRLSGYPKMKEALATLPPKMISLSSTTPPQEIAPEAGDLASRVSVVKTRLRKATFTSQSDAELVPKLYEDYVKRIVGVLQSTLALVGAETAAELELPLLPSVEVPDAAPLRLAVGQLLLRLTDTDGRRAGAEGATQLGAVEDGRLQLLLAGGDAEYSIESCSQVVLPWSPPAGGRTAAFQLDVKTLVDLKQRAASLSKNLQDLDAENPSLASVKKMISDNAGVLVLAFQVLDTSDVQRTTGLDALCQALTAVEETTDELTELGAKKVGLLKDEERLLKHKEGLQQRLRAEQKFKQLGERRDEMKAAEQDVTQVEEAIRLLRAGFRVLQRLQDAAEGFRVLQVAEKRVVKELEENFYREALRMIEAQPEAPEADAGQAVRRVVERMDKFDKEKRQERMDQIDKEKRQRMDQIDKEKRQRMDLIDKEKRQALIDAEVDKKEKRQALIDAEDDKKRQALIQTDLNRTQKSLDRAQKDLEHTQNSLGLKTQELKKNLSGLKACADDTASRSLEQIEPIAFRALRATGSAGERRYGAGQWLTVLQPDGQWVDVQVSTSGALPRVAGQQLPLHPWNHAPRELMHVDFEALWFWWVQMLRARHSHISEALTGKRLDVLQQCVAITMNGSNRGDIVDASSLFAWLRSCHTDRCTGGPVDTPAAALLTGPPAAGKTCLMSQVIIHSLGGGLSPPKSTISSAPAASRAKATPTAAARSSTTKSSRPYALVPVLIKVQQLQRQLFDQPDAFGTAWNWVDAFLRLQHQEQPAVYRFLRQALLARRVLLLLDGLDEGGAKRIDIERHVTEVLAPQGFVMLCTSRPAGLTKENFAGFRRLQLSPLTEAQQKEALEQRLGVGKVKPLLEYLKTVPLDRLGQRVTSNPLMLSMFASVYELRQGVGMPETVVELYEHASEAMLARGGVSSNQLRRLMQAVFFEAHSNRQRDISDLQLDEAAQKENVAVVVLEDLRDRVARDALPLFSLLENYPLRLQSSHLSFQEYFAARALCEEGTVLSGPPPWEWPAWWANAAKLGSEMGKGFGKGLLRAAGVQGDSLDLSRKITGHEPTTAAVLAAIVRSDAVTSVNFSQNSLGDKSGKLIAEALKTNTTLTQLDLGGNNLGDKSGKLIAEALKTNTTLTQLELGGNNLGFKSALAMAQALKVNTHLTSIKLEDTTLPIRQLRGTEPVAAMDLSNKSLGDVSGVVIAHMLKSNTTLAHLDLSGNCLGDESGKLIAEALKTNTTLTQLDLGGNKLGITGARQICGVVAYF